MVSDASKKAAQKKAAVAAKRGGKAVMSSKAAAASNGVNKSSDGVGALTISDRTCTGVICSHLQSRDIHVVKPRPLQVASIPGLLGMFQNVSAIPFNGSRMKKHDASTTWKSKCNWIL
ncbi:uncharacterized protein A4U43_C02F4310 [Asparagus officinalis]|uniref:Uncharacterized protein n=1 Tax=Asparagus officinalis TaxID=4686 RepID=A0A5P1FJV6_ASPOF|nr:uncharacterized protein A4U43_C02F4310 [Asparagus officinalis]